jgi:hypothetical protein
VQANSDPDQLASAVASWLRTATGGKAMNNLD